jgi:hypothetical protein
MIGLSNMDADKGRNMHLAAIAASLLWMTSAQSAEIIRHDGIIVLKGVIEKGDDKKFAKITFAMPEAFVILNSPGGRINTALAISTLINNHNYTTAVRDGTICNSACTLIWLAGKQRILITMPASVFIAPRY